MKVAEYEFEELIEDEKVGENREADGETDDTNPENIEEKLKNIIENTQKEAQKQSEIIKEQAKKEGFEVGYKEGFEKGAKEAKEKFDRIIAEYTAKMEQAINKLVEKSNDIDEKYRQLELNATDAVLSIASKVIAKKIEEDKDAIAAMIKEALNLTQSKKIKLKLNPESARNIADKLETLSSDKVIEIVEDSKLSKGSVMLEEEDGNIIDAGVDAKLEQIKNSIKNE